MENRQHTFGTFFWRITASHMVTYMIMGMIAASLLNYKELFEDSLLSCMYRPFESPWIAAGPGLQIIRGFVFAAALWYFKEGFLYQKLGWLKLWGLLVGLAILSTAGAPPGSIEGFIYTKIPVSDQLTGYLEIMPQTLFFSIFVCYWYKYPKKAWNILAGILVSLIILMSVMGVLAANGMIPAN
jgi:hypothetical protein